MKRIAAVLLIAALLTACADNDMSSEAVLESAVDSEKTTPFQTVSAAESAAPTVTFSAVKTAQADVEEYDYSSFDIADYYVDYDECEPLEFYICDDLMTHELDIQAMEAAVCELKRSEFYTSVIAAAYNMFSYENGEFIPDGQIYLNDYYMKYLGYIETEGYVVTPRLVYSGSLSEEEYILCFSMPLPSGCMEWSGTGLFFATVYVNAENEAQVLYEASAQTLHSIDILRYSDGDYHAVFQWGHTSGTAQAVILSFADGEPHIEYSGSKLYYNSIDDNVLCECNHISMLIYRDAQRGYCCVEGVALAEEAAELLLANPQVQALCPDFREHYENGNISVYGGKYIVAGARTYVFEHGLLQHCLADNMVGAKHYLSEEMESVNVNLNQ